MSRLAPGFFTSPMGLASLGGMAANGTAVDLEAAVGVPSEAMAHRRTSKYAANYCFGSVYVPVLPRALSIDTERLDYATRASRL